MSTTDDRDDGSIETRPDAAGLAPEDIALSAEGDDIVVVPAKPEDPERQRRRRAVLALGGVVAAVLIVGAVALVARQKVTESNTTVKTETPTTIATKPISETHPTTVPKKAAPVVVVTTAPQTVPPQTNPPATSAPVVAVAPPPTTPAVAPTVAVTKQYGAAALTWTAPRTLTIVSGHTAPLAVTAHNPTDGTVTLPHPLACTPRLDDSGICTEMAQLIASGQSASAQFTIDAKGIAPGNYTLKIEGVLTIAVTVT